MSLEDISFDEDFRQSELPPQEIERVRKELAERCKAADIVFEVEKLSEDDSIWKIGMKCGRTSRSIRLWPDKSTTDFLAISFEKFVFLSDLEAICSYGSGTGTIEVGIREIGSGSQPSSMLYRRLFGVSPTARTADLSIEKMVIPLVQEGFPDIEISPASGVFLQLSRFNMPSRRVTLKLTKCNVTTHESALSLLKKVSGALFFQIDLLTGLALGLERERRRFIMGQRSKRNGISGVALQYPKTEYDNAPLSLYWYGRSAIGMPLLQYLAFYQVVEFYFPIYSQSDAQRKLKAILKDPTFRGDRDADIAKLLSAIHISRSGTFGDERSQLRATLIECIDQNALRAFLEEDEGRKSFYSKPPKNLSYQKIPIANITADLRNDVADRIYDIRCKIVHTKVDARDGNIELLLPFSSESEQLAHDIELAQFVAQKILISASMKLNIQV